MRTRLLAIGLAGISATLVACGGGGGGNPTPPTTTSTPAPTATPYAYGDSMTFGGATTTAATFAYPSPSPYPSTNTTDVTTQSITVAASPNPFGPASAGDFHTVEMHASALVTRTATTDAWLGLSGSSLLEYGYKSVDDSGNALSAQFASPVTLDEYPETGGASWSNSAATTFTEKDADGTNSTRIYAADGTYTETTTNSKIGIDTTITEDSKGSGQIAAHGMYLGANVDTLVFSAPSSNQITVTVNYVQPPTPSPAPSGQPAPTPSPTIAPRVYTAPAWYGTGAPAFYSQNTTVTANVAYPASCSVPSTYGTSGNELVQTTNRLDTILGYTDTQVQTTYTNAQYGPVCVTISDTQKDFYDYQDDFAAANGLHFHFPGTALSTTTVTETLTLQTGAVIHDTGRRTLTSQSHAVTLTSASVASAVAAVELQAQSVRHARLVKFLRFITQAGKENR